MNGSAAVSRVLHCVCHRGCVAVALDQYSARDPGRYRNRSHPLKSSSLVHLAVSESHASGALCRSVSKLLRVLLSIQASATLLPLDTDLLQSDVRVECVLTPLPNTHRAIETGERFYSMAMRCGTTVCEANELTPPLGIAGAMAYVRMCPNPVCVAL